MGAGLGHRTGVSGGDERGLGPYYNIHITGSWIQHRVSRIQDTGYHRDTGLPRLTQPDGPSKEGPADLLELNQIGSVFVEWCSVNVNACSVNARSCWVNAVRFQPCLACALDASSCGSSRDPAPEGPGRLK